MKKYKHIIVKGKVQGVFYRDYTQRKAKSLGLKGIVRNKPDGSVEIYAVGDIGQLNALEKWCWEGSPFSSVTDVIIEEVSNLKDYPDFRVVF